MTNLKPRSSMEKALLYLLERDYAPLHEHPERIGGDLPVSVGQLYIRVGRVTGAAGQIQGDTVIDVEAYSVSWSIADSAASSLEALLLGYPHVVEVDGRKVVIDRVTHNTGPQDLPWSDDRVYRIGSTYTLTARRQ